MFNKILIIVFITLLNLNNNAFSNDKILNSLKDGKKLVFIRHAIAPGNGDPNNFEIDNCSTKRNLAKNGIEESKISFLIGFTRSVTTLLDTILRSHKDIEVIEEKPLISTIENLVTEKLNTKRDSLYSTSENTINILRKQYFELVKEFTNTKENFS